MAEIYHVKWKAGMIADCTLSDDYDWAAGRFLEVCKNTFNGNHDVHMSVSEDMIFCSHGNSMVSMETVHLEGKHYHEDD